MTVPVYRNLDMNRMQSGICCLTSTLILFVGFFFSLHGKTVGRIWRGNNLVHGSVELFQ